MLIIMRSYVYGTHEAQARWRARVGQRHAGLPSAGTKSLLRAASRLTRHNKWFLKRRPLPNCPSVSALVKLILEAHSGRMSGVLPTALDRRWSPRLARRSDIPALEKLIPLSVRGLQTIHYSPEQIEAALGPVFGVDRQLIEDQTFFVIEIGEQLIACGAWSRRQTLFGSDEARTSPDPELDPGRDAGRLRAFFVHPEWARRGLGRALLVACEAGMSERGFVRAELVATLPGELLYQAFGYRVIDRFEIPLRDGLKLPVVRMGKELSSPG